jgi:hypothetical protein
MTMTIQRANPPQAIPPRSIPVAVVPAAPPLAVSPLAADLLAAAPLAAAAESHGSPAVKRAGRAAIANGYEIDADFVVYRLEEAGATLLALPDTGYSTRLRTSSLEIVRTALESYGWSDAQIRPSIPSAEKISRMDEAMSWIPFIPLDRYVLRRVVGARSLVHPITDRHLFPWRRLGKALGADHKAIQRWHAQGIAMIVAALNGA